MRVSSGKWAYGTYSTDSRETSWLKIKNPDYSEIEDRRELFDALGQPDALKMKLPQLELRLA